MDLETIRRITILARTEGVDRATAELKRLSDTQQGVAGTAERSSRANLSVERSFESLQRRVDVTHRAQKDYERDVALLARAYDQGLIPSTTRLNELMALTAQRYNQTLAAGSRLTTGQQALGAATAAATTQATGLASSLGSVGSVMAGLGPIGLATAAAIGAVGLALVAADRAAHAFAEDMGRIRDASRNLGITTLQFQAIADAGAALGLTEERVRTGFERLTAQMEEFRRRSGAAYEAIRGIDPALADQIAASESLTQQIDLLGAAYERMSVSQRAATSRALFGRGGADLGLLVQQIRAISGGVASLEGDFRRSGDAIDEAMIQRVARLKREIDDTAGDAQRNLAAIFAPSVLEAELAFVNAFREFSRLAREFTASTSLTQVLTGIANLPANLPSLLFKQIPEFAARQFTGTPAEPSTFGPDEAGMANIREYFNLQNQVTIQKERQLALEQQQLAVASARTVPERLIAQENVNILQALMAGKNLADAVYEARLKTAIAEAQIHASFEAQIRALEQQVELAHARTEEERAALQAEHAYINALERGATQSQAMALSSATLELALANARRNAEAMVGDFAQIANYAAQTAASSSAWVKGLDFEGTSGGDSGISALINVPAGGVFQKISEMTQAETEEALEALRRQPQVPWVREQIESLERHLRDLTDATNALNRSTIGLSELYTTDPRLSHIGFREFRAGGIMSALGPLPLRRYQRGGVASSPQLALYGEGSVPEAYVPVPSGRIPVKIEMPRGTDRPIQIVQNFTGVTAPEARNQMKQSGYQLAQDLRRSLS